HRSANLSPCVTGYLYSPLASFGAPECHDRHCGACCRKAARIRHHAQERTGYKCPFRLDICDGGCRATMPTNARGAHARLSRRPLPSSEKKGTLGDSVALGSACAMRRKREDEDAGRSREEKIICPPGRPIQVFTPLRAKRRKRRPKRSPTSPPSIPTENPLTASPSSTWIRNHRRTPRLSVTWRRPRWATSSTISAGTPARRVCARTHRTPMWSDATSWS